MASYPLSGTQTAVNSSARRSLASASASRRLVLTQSPGFLRDQRRRDDHAGMANFGGEAMKAVTRRRPPRSKSVDVHAEPPLDGTPHVLFGSIDLADVTNFASTLPVYNCDCVTQFGHVDADEKPLWNALWLAFCREGSIGQSEQPSNRRCRASLPAKRRYDFISNWQGRHPYRRRHRLAAPRCQHLKNNPSGRNSLRATVRNRGSDKPWRIAASVMPSRHTFASTPVTSSYAITLPVIKTKPKSTSSALNPLCRGGTLSRPALDVLASCRNDGKRCSISSERSK